MIKFLRRVVTWWWHEVKAPFESEPPRQPAFDDASEPVEAPPLTDISVAYPELRKPEGVDTRGVITPEGEQALVDQVKPPTDRDLMTPNEKALWEDIEGGKPKHERIEYPPVREQSTQDWVTERLQQLTGGLTRHPFDLTQYPTPPTEADKAAREHFNRPTPMPTPRAYFTHGYSMRYLDELLRRADKRDMSLSAEDLMSLRSRGLA